MSDEELELNESVGQRLRLRRLMAHMSQQELGLACGLSAQQVWKYEHGLSAMSISKLWHFSQALGTPMSWLLQEPEQAPVSDDLMRMLSNPDSVEVLQIFDSINEQAVRRGILEMLRSYSAACTAEDMSFRSSSRRS